MNVHKQHQGMTLVEIMISVSLIALIFVVAIPLVSLGIRSKENAACASKLRRAVAAFEMYRSEMGRYPPDQVVPSQTSIPAMANYFSDLSIDWWGDETELGGRWDWDIGYHDFAASLSIWQPSASEKQLIEFDRLIDDGDLDTGKFRKVSTQYHYILEN